MRQLTHFSSGVGKLPVFYTYEMDGGGTTFGQEIPDMVALRYPSRRFRYALEWCSGPGFIGYNLFDHRLIDNLCLVDLYHPAIEMAKTTANVNDLQGKVKFYLLDDMSLLPISEKFDLVVASPPHFSQSVHTEYHRKRIVFDQDWDAHRNFYNHIKKNLSADGVILMQENLSGSTVETFRPMIEDAGLKIKDWYLSPDFCSGQRGTLIYYLEITHKESK